MPNNVQDRLANGGEITGVAPGATDDLAAQARLVAALRDAAAAGAPMASVAVIETHISYVLLTGRFAYKIKKAVGLGFLDFRTLDARRFYCDEELRLNRRFAPALYLEVVPITGSVDAPRFGGDGTPIEYAVKMREFPRGALASEALARGELAAAHVDALAVMVAAAHAAAAVAPAGSRFGDPDEVLGIAMKNFEEIRPLLDNRADLDDLDGIGAWTTREHARIRAAMARRRDQGLVRECHGDLHLGNIALVDGALTIFDCIEFNDKMRWIDVMSEIAFTVMDLRDRGRPDFSHRFRNRYLEITGDYDGLEVLRFYLVYRAMVRAKIARLRARQVTAVGAKTSALAEYREYLRLAEHYIEPRIPSIIITHGLSGSGKTALSQALLEQTGALRIRTDVERARGFGRSRDVGDGTRIDAGPYAPETTRAVYGYVRDLTRNAIGTGASVIVDGTFLKRWQRQSFRDLATELGVPFVVVSFTASEATLRERIVRRMRDGSDASEADLSVLAHQIGTREPLAADEAPDVVTYDAEAPLHEACEARRWQGVIDRIRPAAPEGVG